MDVHFKKQCAGGSQAIDGIRQNALARSRTRRTTRSMVIWWLVLTVFAAVLSLTSGCQCKKGSQGLCTSVQMVALRFWTLQNNCCDEAFRERFEVSGDSEGTSPCDQLVAFQQAVIGLLECTTCLCEHEEWRRITGLFDQLWKDFFPLLGPLLIDRHLPEEILPEVFPLELPAGVPQVPMNPILIMDPQGQVDLHTTATASYIKSIPLALVNDASIPLNQLGNSFEQSQDRTQTAQIKQLWIETVTGYVIEPTSWLTASEAFGAFDFDISGVIEVANFKDLIDVQTATLTKLHITLSSPIAGLSTAITLQPSEGNQVTINQAGQGYMAAVVAIDITFDGVSFGVGPLHNVAIALPIQLDPTGKELRINGTFAGTTIFPLIPSVDSFVSGVFNGPINEQINGNKVGSEDGQFPCQSGDPCEVIPGTPNVRCSATRDVCAILAALDCAITDPSENDPLYCNYFYVNAPCCMPNGQCMMVRKAHCFAMNGVPQDLFDSCDEVSCTNTEPTEGRRSEGPFQQTPIIQSPVGDEDDVYGPCEHVCPKGPTQRPISQAGS